MAAPPPLSAGVHAGCETESSLGQSSAAQKESGQRAQTPGDTCMYMMGLGLGLGLSLSCMYSYMLGVGLGLGWVRGRA